jgi:hypothetical protein
MLVYKATNLAPKESPVKVMSDAKAKALLEARLKAEIAEKKNKQVAAASSPRSKSVVSIKPTSQLLPRNRSNHLHGLKWRIRWRNRLYRTRQGCRGNGTAEIAPEPEVVPDLDGLRWDGIRPGNLSPDPTHHCPAVVVSARQSAKSYDKSYLELQSQQQALDAKLGRSKRRKPIWADDALKAQYNEKRKALELSVTPSKATDHHHTDRCSVGTVCDELRRSLRGSWTNHGIPQATPLNDIDRT